MELSKQVTSLELSRQLKEAGVKQESLYFWCSNAIDWAKEAGYNLYPAGYVSGASGIKVEELGYSAPTCAELGEMMPVWIKNPHRQMLKIWKCKNSAEQEQWAVWYEDDFTFPKEDNTPEFPVWAETMVEAMAKMLIYLAEQKLVTLTK